MKLHQYIIMLGTLSLTCGCSQKIKIIGDEPMYFFNNNLVIALDKNKSYIGPAKNIEDAEHIFDVVGSPVIERNRKCINFGDLSTPIYWPMGKEINCGNYKLHRVSLSSDRMNGEVNGFVEIGRGEYRKNYTLVIRNGSLSNIKAYHYRSLDGKIVETIYYRLFVK